MPQLIAAYPVLVTVLEVGTAAATVAGTGISVAASIAQGQQQRKAAEFQSKELEQQALETKQQAGLQVAAQDQRSARILSSIRTSAAASGIEISSGSPLESYNVASEQSQLNDMYTKYAANLLSQGQQSQAELTRWGGKNAETTGYLTAGGDVISGLGSLARFGLRSSKRNKSNTVGIG